MTATIDNERTIVIGSRKSQLALVQTYWVKKELETWERTSDIDLIKFERNI